MALSNRDRVGKALELLRAGLYPFVERELRAKYGDEWESKGQEQLKLSPGQPAAAPADWDVPALLGIIDGDWQYLFRNKLGRSDRSLIFELRDFRNSWAHQKPFTVDDTNRALDSAKRLLTSVNAPEVDEVDKHLQEVLRQRFEDLTKRETRKAATAAMESRFTSGLPAWRDVITPHADVASGNFLLAEFAADLWQVYQSQFETEHKAPAEYADPVEFFRRTYLTAGLGDLLTLAIKRITGQVGDPVVKLQTNFGGGKTHSMLGLYHLFSGISPSRLAGLEPLMTSLGIAALPKVHRAVLVGNKLSLTGFKKPDGITVRTLWGELAWQLGHSSGRAKEAYEMVRVDDEKGVCPGGLVTLLRTFSPCIVLIDEWVAFVRQLYNTPGLPAGSFDANITFAQSLTEAFKAAPGSFLVASLPASDIEIGGEGGRDALKRLENTFDRVQSTWRPATVDECFEIVRRRLFQSIDAEKFPVRDLVARAFADMYRQSGSEYPTETREGDYERRLQSSYPIHPELFDRLFQDWGTLERFQKTRGVLRLMASVIHSLWERQDGNLLILPATVPMEDPQVINELTRYMDERWTPVIEKDVDGPNSLPLRLDRDNPSFGRLSAARRVARTLYLGSAPTSTSNNRGIDDRRIKLGCAQPGESAAVFGDALRRLSDQATHVYVDKNRYWLATQPSVTRVAQDRAAQIERKMDDVHAEIIRRVRAEQSSRGEFAKIHPCPSGTGDVPDEQETRLVILPPDAHHIAKSLDSPAMKLAKEYWEQRGGSPRLYRNTLIFLAPDRTRLAELQQAVCQYLSWSSIKEEAEELNLDAFQSRQVTTKSEEADDTVATRIPETFQWLIVPTQDGTQAPVEFSEVRLQGSDKLAVRATKKLINDGNLSTRYAGTLLRQELDRVPLWRGEHVTVKQLVEDFAQYTYLPRLKNPQVLLDAVKDGVSRLTWHTDGFGYADFYDEKAKRYAGLKTASLDSVTLDAQSVVVRSDAANRQLSLEAAELKKRHEQERSKDEGSEDETIGETEREDRVKDKEKDDQDKKPKIQLPTRFYGNVAVAPDRLGRDAGRIAQEVLAHIAGLHNADVKVTIEIQADIKEGVDPAIVRAVTENCKVLKFTTFGFE
jgi:predicted AAA+ superfamily ATPase